MIIFYDSLTGMVKNFSKRLGFEMKDVRDLDLNNIPDEMILITRSWDFGKIPDSTLDFLDDLADFNKLSNLKGVAVSGNKNWGQNFGKAGDTIQKEYGIPLVIKFEGSGFKKDVDFVKEYIQKVLK